MKKIMINNEKDLLSFLEVVAKESVAKSLRESDSLDHNVTKYNQQKKKDMKVFKALKEEETETSANTPDQEEDKVDVEKIDNAKTSLKNEITPRQIIAQINNIRAGHSLKNSDVKENLISFLERLDENEVLVLFYYLEGISQILNQTMKGADVIDPSENPLNIHMNRGDNDKDAEVSSNAKPEKSSKSRSPEDTSPPIKVNENQYKEDIRRKIRILMS